MKYLWSKFKYQKLKDLNKIDLNSVLGKELSVKTKHILIRRQCG